MYLQRMIAFVLFGMLSLQTATGQETPGCDPDHQGQFDFWIGEWEVRTSQGLAGTNTVSRLLDGCILQEKWTSASGTHGTSLNFYNPSIDRWQQFWVWQNGTTLEFEGEYTDGKMILEGSSVGQDGVAVMNRITWFDNPDGTVRQLWEQSPEGTSWTTVFDGMYRKKSNQKD